MNPNNIKKFIKFWAYGSGISLIVFLIYWFTGWRKFYFVEAHDVGELFVALWERPHVLIGAVLVGGFMCAIGLYLVKEKKWPLV